MVKKKSDLGFLIIVKYLRQVYALSILPSFLPFWHSFWFRVSQVDDRDAWKDNYLIN